MLFDDIVQYLQLNVTYFMWLTHEVMNTIIFPWKARKLIHTFRALLMFIKIFVIHLFSGTQCITWVNKYKYYEKVIEAHLYHTIINILFLHKLYVNKCLIFITWGWKFFDTRKMKMLILSVNDNAYFQSK